MQTVKLKLIHAFGSSCSKNYRNCLAICDEDKNQPKIVFPAGKTLARKYIDRSEMDFIQFSQTAQNIECLTVLPTKSHVAVVEKPFSSNLQLIKIYSMSNKQDPQVIKIFNESQKVGIIKQIVFSASQPKFMCALIGQPHNKLIFIDTSRNKPLAESNFTLKDTQKISICPQNSHLICVNSGNSIKLYKIQEYAFKPLQDIRKFPKNRIITDHTWYRKKMMLVATDKCQILVIQQIKSNVYEVRQQYHNVFNELQPEKLIITAICPFSKGFILGSNNGKFCLWTRKQDINSLQGDQKLQLTRKWSTTAERMSSVSSISINQKQDMLVISMLNNDIAMLYLNQIIPQISQMIRQTNQKQINFEYLYKGFHSKSITGMDICQQRPLFATCSRQDSTIRIWNYKNYGCKLLRMFYFKIKIQQQQDKQVIDKPLITLSFHPSGYYMAVGCSDKLRLFHVLNNQLRPFKQIGIKNTHLVKFSKGGHLLALAHKFNDDLEIDHVRIYNSLTLQQIICFKDIQSPAKTLQWKNYDQTLSCIYQNGVVHEWKVADWTLAKKIYKKQLEFQTGVYNHSSNSILTYGSNANSNKSYLQEFYQNNVSKNIEVDMKISKIIEIPIRKDKSCFVLALQNGTLTSFGGIEFPSILNHQNHHTEKVNQLIISPCGNYLITCGSDSLIFIYQITIFSSQNQILNPLSNNISSTVVDDFLSDVVLINKKQIVKYTQKQKQFTKVINNLSKKLKMLSQEGQKRQQKNISDLQIQKNRVIEDITYRIDKVKDQIQQLKVKNDSSLNGLDQKNISQAEALQKTYQQKIAFQEQKHFQLQQQLIQLKVLHKKKLQSLHRQQEEQIKSLKKEFEKKFKQSELVFSQIKQQNVEATNIFQLRLKQIQQEQQDQVRQLQSKKQKFKLQTAAVLQQFHQKLQKLKKQYNSLERQRNQVKTENQQLKFQKKKLQKEVGQIKEKLKDLLVDFQEKIQSLKNKQQKIVDFEDKVNELQKKKHILSYKATQMKKAIEPKDYQIEKLKSDLIKLKKQFQTSLERKQKANLQLQKVNKEKQYLQKCYDEEKKSTSQQINIIDQLLLDIYFCLQKGKKTQAPVAKKQEITVTNQKQLQSLQPIQPSDYKIYFKELIKLYHKYVEKQKDNSTKNIDNSNDKNLDDITKQIVHLEKSLFQINKSNEKNILRKNDQIYKRTKQNTELINNLNEIKKQNKELILKIKSKNLEIQNLKNLKNDLLNNCPKTNSVTFKLMATDENLGGDWNYNSNKKSSTNIVQGGKGFLPMRQKSVKNLNSSGVSSKQQLLKLNPVQKSLMTQIPSDKINYQKKQCQIISEIEFINQKIYKFEFYLKDMTQKIKKHSIYAECQKMKDLVVEKQIIEKQIE